VRSIARQTVDRLIAPADERVDSAESAKDLLKVAILE
jgi:hypothetical protein